MRLKYEFFGRHYYFTVSPTLKNKNITGEVRLRKKTLHIVFIGIGLLSFFPAAVSAQETDQEAMTRRLERLRRNPLVRQILEGSRLTLTVTQQRLLLRAVDSMNDAEVEQTLKDAGYSADGSIYEKRERLRIALGLTTPPELPEERARSRISLENAAEGEYFQGQDDKRGLLRLSGRIRVRLPGGVFEADTVLIDTERKEMYAEGSIVYRGEGNAEIKGERVVFDQRLGVGIIYNVSGYRDPVYFFGASMTQLSEQKFAVSRAYFTGCAAQRPHYNFSARKLWIYENNKIVAVGVLYYVGGVPLIPLPFLYASEWGTGIIAQAGWGRIQGYYLQTTYQFSVPSSYQSAWQPLAYRFKADAYEHTGKSSGAEFYKFSPNLNYVVQLGASEYKRYEIVSDFREKNGIRVTDQVHQAYNDRFSGATVYGGIGQEFYKWYKIYTIFNFRSQDYATNSSRNLHLRYEDYSHRLYDFEFGGRYQPVSTIPALYLHHEAGRGLIHNDTNWNLVLNETHNDLNLRIEATRNRVWLEKTAFQDSRYIPVVDIVPSVDITKKMFLGRIPFFNMPVYWDNLIHTDQRKDYSGGERFRTLNFNQFTSSVRSSISFYPYITIDPMVGYGAQKSVPLSELSTLSSSEKNALETQARKNSYQFWNSQNTLTFGPDFIFLRATYRRKDSFKEEQKDTALINIKGFTNNQKVNETEVALETFPAHSLHFSVQTIYDQRNFEFEVKNRDRWYYPVFRADIYMNFLNLFGRERENLLSRQKVHFIGLRLTDDYIYDPYKTEIDATGYPGKVRTTTSANVFGANFVIGGFDLWLLRRLRFLELGYYWYHVYGNQRLDHMRYLARADIQIYRWIFFEMELESRATAVERYATDSKNSLGYPNHVNFSEDVINGTGLNGQAKKQDSIFNVAYFEAAVILDLHDWEIRLGYSIEQRSILAGVTSLDTANFYDNKVFFSMTLLRFDVGSISDRPSRFLIQRRRVRPSDVGRTSLSSTRLY